MVISSIVAKAQNNVIGKDNQLIWKLPADMKFFKEKTDGHCIITGRKNYESIPEKFRPLPNRTNIVVTRQKDYQAPGAVVVESIEKALEIAREKGEQEAFIIGGAEIYKQTMTSADRLYVTEIHHEFEGDVFFPVIENSQWEEVSRQSMQPDEKNKYSYDFCVYERS